MQRQHNRESIMLLGKGANGTWRRRCSEMYSKKVNSSSTVILKSHIVVETPWKQFSKLCKSISHICSRSEGTMNWVPWGSDTKILVINRKSIWELCPRLSRVRLLPFYSTGSSSDSLCYTSPKHITLMTSLHVTYQQ